LRSGPKRRATRAEQEKFEDKVAAFIDAVDLHVLRKDKDWNNKVFAEVTAFIWNQPGHLERRLSKLRERAAPRFWITAPKA
jgi:hypothetical protein